jgi:DNA-directed RNA polymerase subunit RPC12/RpoP
MAAKAGAEVNLMSARKTIYGNCVRCGRYARLVRDHNHKTGKDRGLVCNGCNSRIGAYQNNLDEFMRTQAYLAAYDSPVIVSSSDQTLD